MLSVIRMFRGLQILTWSCPLRPLLLLLRESHLAAFSADTCAGRRGGSTARDGSHEVVQDSKTSPLSTGTVSCSTQLSAFRLDSHNEQLRETSFQNFISKAILSSHYYYPQVYDSANAKQSSDCWKCTVVENVAQNLKAVSIYQSCLISTTYPQPWRRLWDVSQRSHSLFNKTQCNIKSRLYYSQNFVRPLSLSTHQAWTLNHNHRSPQPCSIDVHQTRAVHQAAAPDAWRRCLSPENERRCRQSLGPNLKLYESDTARTSVFQSQGKNQARRASVLVSLCSVEGEPALLFTLRSSKLKGKHKGDVSFAGGKSDPSDRDVVATALREAKEELGVNVTAERVWGILKPLRDLSGMMVAPVLANLGPLEKLAFKPNPGEVEEIFTLSLSHLCNPQNRGYTHFRTGNKYGYTTPVFHNGKYRVWGLTAIALDHTLKLIVPS